MSWSLKAAKLEGEKLTFDVAVLEGSLGGAALLHRHDLVRLGSTASPPTAQPAARRPTSVTRAPRHVQRLSPNPSPTHPLRAAGAELRTAGCARRLHPTNKYTLQQRYNQPTCGRHRCCRATTEPAMNRVAAPGCPRPSRAARPLRRPPTRPPMTGVHPRSSASRSRRASLPSMIVLKHQDAPSGRRQAGACGPMPSSSPTGGVSPLTLSRSGAATTASPRRGRTRRCRYSIANHVVVLLKSPNSRRQAHLRCRCAGRRSRRRRWRGVRLHGRRRPPIARRTSHRVAWYHRAQLTRRTYTKHCTHLDSAMRAATRLLRTFQSRPDDAPARVCNRGVVP